MNKEIGKNTRIKIATAGMGAAFLLSGLGAMSENVSGGNVTENKIQPSEHLIPVPCAEPMPWEQSTNDNSVGQLGKIELASIKNPEPKPNRNQSECWIIEKNPTNTTSS